MAKTLLLLFIFFIWDYGHAQKHKISTEVFFKTDSSTLSGSEYLKLESLSKIADTVQISNISISAYCDDIGSKSYNETLSVKRARQVKALFLSLSVPENIMETKGNGEVALTNDKNIEQARANNRIARVTITYTLKQKEKMAEAPKESPKAKELPAPKPEIPLTDNQKVGDKITLENLLFIGGRHVLLPESYDDLEALTTVLLEKKKYHIMILGHICCVHDGHDGLDFDTGIDNLSQARAKAIYNYLVQHGVSADRLQYKGLKHDYPTGLGDKRDRRVEIEITKIVSD